MGLEVYECKVSYDGRDNRLSRLFRVSTDQGVIRAATLAAAALEAEGKSNVKIWSIQHKGSVGLLDEDAETALSWLESQGLVNIQEADHEGE